MLQRTQLTWSMSLKQERIKATFCRISMRWEMASEVFYVLHILLWKLAHNLKRGMQHNKERHVFLLSEKGQCSKSGDLLSVE